MASANSLHADRHLDGGGVMFLFHSTMHTVEQVIAPVSPPAPCNFLSVMDTSNGHCWVLVASDTEVMLNSPDSLLSYYYKYVSILGDFSMPGIRWQTEVNSSLSSYGHNLIHFCDSWDHDQIVDKPRRDEYVIDLIFTTNQSFSKVAVDHPMVNSDHNTIIVDVCKRP